MKREVARFDFKAFGQAIKAARKAKGISRNQLADKMNIAPRYIASIENSGQHPSLQIFYELVTLLDVSVDQFFFPDKETDKSTQRRQLETLLDSMDNKDLTVITATAKAIQEVKNETAGGIKSPVFSCIQPLGTPQIAVFFLFCVRFWHFLVFSVEESKQKNSKHRKRVPTSVFSPSRAAARRLKIACTLTGYRLLGQTLGKCPKPSMNGKER